LKKESYITNDFGPFTKKVKKLFKNLLVMPVLFSTQAFGYQEVSSGEKSNTTVDYASSVLNQNDFVGISFWIATAIMLPATVFFFI